MTSICPSCGHQSLVHVIYGVSSGHWVAFAAGLVAGVAACVLFLKLSTGKPSR